MDNKSNTSNIGQQNPTVYRTALQVALIQGGLLTQEGGSGSQRQWRFVPEEITDIQGLQGFEPQRTYGSIDEAVDHFARAVQNVNVQNLAAA